MLALRRVYGEKKGLALVNYPSDNSLNLGLGHDKGALNALLDALLYMVY